MRGRSHSGASAYSCLSGQQSPVMLGWFVWTKNLLAFRASRLSLWAPALTALAVVALAGCGGGLPAGVVARVGRLSITKTEYDHAMAIVAVRDARPNQSASSVRELELSQLAKILKESVLQIPVPPDYTACVARWHAIATQPVHPRPPPRELQTKCAEEYKALQGQALGSLIISEWTLAEAAGQGISVKQGEVEHQLHVSEQKQYHSEAEFQKYLAATG
jgi:hypothetical protein